MSEHHGVTEKRGDAEERRSRQAQRPDEVAALEEERDFLLGSLRDLEHEREASDIDEADYHTLHDDYTARAAAVLRALEDAQTHPAEPPAPESTEPSAPEPTEGAPRGRDPAPRGARSRPGLAPRSAPSGAPPANRARRAVIGITIVLVVAVTGGVALSSFTGDRGGDNVSGTAASETGRHAAKAQQLEGEGKAAEALKEYDAAIAADPTNVVALTYKGWLLARAGFADQAMASLDKAIGANPGYPDAHFFRGMVLYEGRQDAAGAVPEFEAYLASNPPPSAADAVRGVLEKARNASAAPAPPTAGPAAPAPG